MYSNEPSKHRYNDALHPSRGTDAQDWLEKKRKAKKARGGDKIVTVVNRKDLIKSLSTFFQLDSGERGRESNLQPSD